jgi:hypothetical protein
MVEKTIVLNAETEKATQNVDAFNKGLKETDKSTKKLNKDLKDTKGDLTGVQSSADAATGGLISGFKNSVGAIKGVVKGFKSLKVALAATGIGLIVVLFASLKEAFEDSEEGANKFSRILGVVGTVVDNFLDLLADLGEAIIGVFENPKKAIKSFVTSFENLVIRKFNAFLESIGLIGSALKKVFKGDFDEALKDATKGFSKLNEEFNVIAITAKKVTEATKKFIDENIKESKKAIEVADMRSKANKLERELLVERSVLENKIANLRLKSRQEEEFTAEQRKGFILEAQDLQDSLLKKETEVLQLRFKAQEAQNKFGRSNIEALDATAEAEAAVNRQSALRLNQQKATQKELNTLNKQIQAEQKAAATEKKRLDDEEIKRSQEKIDAEKKRLDLLKQEQSKADNEEAIRAEQQWNLLQEITNTAQEQELLKLTQQYEAKFALANGNAELEKALEEQLQIDLAAIDNKYLQASIEAKEKADDEILSSDELTAKAKIDNQNAILSATSSVLSSIGQIADAFAGDDEERAKKAFNINKGLGIAQAIISTSQGIMNAYTNPVDVASGVAFAKSIAIGLAGASQIATIATTEFKPSGGGSSSPTTSTNQDLTSTSQAPSFNVVGQSGFNQVAGALSGQQPVQAFVVSGDVTTAQQLQNNTITQATF